MKTTDDVLAKVEEIRSLAENGDHEAAHTAEDKLHQQVLKLIATRVARRDGGPSAKLLAHAALQTLEIKFDRYMA